MHPHLLFLIKIAWSTQLIQILSPVDVLTIQNCSFQEWLLNMKHLSRRKKKKKTTILHFINEFNTSMPFSLPVFKSNLVLLALKNIIKYSLLGSLCLIDILGRTILVQLYLHLSLYILHFHSSSSPNIVRPRKTLLCVLEKPWTTA